MVLNALFPVLNTMPQNPQVKPPGILQCFHLCFLLAILDRVDQKDNRSVTGLQVELLPVVATH